MTSGCFANDNIRDLKEAVLDKLDPNTCQRFLAEITDLKFNATNEFCATDEVSSPFFPCRAGPTLISEKPLFVTTVTTTSLQS